jgi:uncharacterized OB-fold protein
VTGPQLTADNRFYFEALAEHRLLVQSCTNCGHSQNPPMPACSVCGSREFSTVETEPTGTVYSWIRVHRRELLSLPESEAVTLPVVIVTVAFPDCWRTFGRFTGTEAPQIGDTVHGSFVDHPGWTELTFTGEPA